MSEPVPPLADLASTYQRALEACNSMLYGEGTWPSRERIKARIGTGSNDVIDRALRDVRDRAITTLRALPADKPVPHALSIAVLEVWAAAQREAGNDFAPQLEKAEQEASQAQRQCASLLAELEDANAESVEQSATLASLRTQMSELRAEVEAERNRANEAAAVCAALRLEHASQAAAAAQRERDMTERHIASMDELRLRTDEQRKADLQRLDDAHQRVKQLEVRLADDAARAQARIDELNNALHAATETAQEMRRELDAVVRTRTGDVAHESKVTRLRRRTVSRVPR